jgi:hypothetical protein
MEAPPEDIMTEIHALKSKKAVTRRTGACAGALVALPNGKMGTVRKVQRLPLGPVDRPIYGYSRHLLDAGIREAWLAYCVDEDGKPFWTPVCSAEFAA